MSDYHHGDLANALLQSARTVLNEKGIHKLSLRACAAHAGVSHAAPAHHFKSLRGLLTELAIIAFDEFTEALQIAYEEVLDEPPGIRLQKVCQAYIDFAAKEHGLFDLMFSSTPLDYDNPRLNISSRNAYQQLTGIVHPLFDQKMMPESERTQAEVLIWSVVHGYANLLVKQQARRDTENCDESDTVLPDLCILGRLLK